MNRNRNLVIDFGIMTKTEKGNFTTRHDHYINSPEDKHVQPHRDKHHATKKKR